MKSFFLVLLFAVLALAQSNSDAPSSKTWNLGGGTVVKFALREGKPALWSGEDLLLELDASEEIQQALEDDGWLLLRVTTKRAADGSPTLASYSRLILVRANPPGKPLAQAIFARNAERMTAGNKAIPELKSLSKKDGTAVVRMTAQYEGVSSDELRDIRLLTGEIVLAVAIGRAPSNVSVPVSDLAPMYFQATDVREVATYYTDLSKQQTIGIDQLSGNLTIQSEPVSRERRVELLEEAFFKAGIGLVEVKPGLIHFIRLAPRVAAKDLPVVVKAEDLPKPERVVTFIYKTKSRPPLDLVEALAQEGALDFASNHIFSAQPDGRGGVILFGGSSGALRKVLHRLEMLDPSPNKESK